MLDQLASDLEKAPKVVSQTSVEEAPEETRTHEQNEKEDTPLQKESTDATKKVLEDISEKITYAAEVELSTDWAYFIDSGGQPAYRELLPLFSRTAALNIIVIDLTKGLDKKYGFEYRIGEKDLPINTELKYSNLDIIRSTISSEAILKPIKVPYVSDVTEMPDHPYYLIIGTRKDKVKEEDIKAMNETLKNSDLKLQHVIWKTYKSIIFPVNTLLSADSKDREEASVELCTVVSNHNASMKIKMPIRLFAFEIALQKEAEEREQSFLTKNEVDAVGELLQLNNEDIEKALEYLHNVTIILYYPDVLQNVIFVDPQPILDILSCLIAITYVDQAQLCLIINPLPSPYDINNLRNNGCFKDKLLVDIVSKSDVSKKSRFQPPDMIKLLKHLHIITEVENRKEGDYFFPCALPSYNELKNPPSTKNDTQPLLVVWKEDDDEILPVPQGMFPLIVVHLLNQEAYKVDFPPSGPNYYKCYDAMSLRVSKRYTLHIINRYTHIELYFDGDKKCCPEVWGLVDEAIKSSSNDINVQQTHTRAFKCPEDTEGKCYCIVENYHSTYCTKCPSSCDIPPNDDSYWCWISDSQPGK